jgi:hypothetical protein
MISCQAQGENNTLLIGYGKRRTAKQSGKKGRG